MNLVSVATWEKNKFSLNIVPTKSCFLKILRAEDSISSLEQLSELRSQRRSLFAPRIPELEEYLYSVTLEIKDPI
jgi:hypothetical protein